MEELLNYENLIYSVINKYKNYDKEDLYQAGMIGLINAYKNYDSSYDNKFTTYAYYYIKGEVLKYIRENNVIKISKDIVRLNSSIEKTKELMRQRLGREPSITEISLFLEIEEKDILLAQTSCQDIKSLDYEYEDEIEMYNSIQIYENAYQADILDLKAQVSALDEEEKQLILERYYNDSTQKETSKKLGISQVQVSRKENKILQKLKTSL